jgi:hypothetical protein
VRAIDILLKKVLPDLSAVTVSGDNENPLLAIIERRIVKAGD